VFGAYALASSIVALSYVLPNFGMGGAFLHRAPETEDEGEAAAVHFTLKCLFTLAWAGALAVYALTFTSGLTRTALLVVTGTSAGIALTQTPRLILTRRVVHRRLALLDLVTTLCAALVAIILAWRGQTLWALLATNVVALALNLLFLYLWRPVWRPRFAWSSQRVRYFLGFGSRNFVAVALLRALDRVDDLWTGLWLGEMALGFYSKAYQFATYPRAVLAGPVNQVAGGTYAELKGDRRRLSMAFYRTNAVLVRSGFLLAGVLALVAPEFIRLFLGEKWLPMLDAFRLMLVFTLLDPIKVTVANLFVAVGRPELVVRARAVQLIVLLASLFVLGSRWGIAGVALSVDLMLVVGIVLLLWQSRSYVSFSTRRLFAVPSLALLLGLPSALACAQLAAYAGSDWATAATKIVVLTAVYALILVLFERRELARIAASVAKSISSGKEVPAPWAGNHEA
jgi:O-antigen/teichoic acid export membrane protein